MSARPSLQIDLRTPTGSAIKQDLRPLPQNQSGAKSEQRQGLSMSKQAPLPPIQPFVDMPPRDQRQAFNFITMGRFRIPHTIIGARIFTFILLLANAVVFILTATGFWVSLFMFIRSLLSWRLLGSLLFEVTLRWLSGWPTPTPIWSHLSNYTDSYHLGLAVQRSSSQGSPIIYSTSIPLMVDSSLVWFSVVVLMFIGHHTSSFAHTCLRSPPND